MSKGKSQVSGRINRKIFSKARPSGTTVKTTPKAKPSGMTGRA